ncbi:hypothetical protein B9Z55_020314 [Caenorhabditis nigoni]|uniref:Serpentine receptor class gamma n=1 Tax=Caenorhabditis nigoni TaxID=1611254 RepID=A0A2G5TMN6_9PELO|nr:hypothetical protein B9Z55_020314 [Caenorhabditis nigoni]
MNTILPANGSIHGIPACIDYTPDIDFSTLQAFIPLIYIIPTTGIMITILVMYRNAKKNDNAASMDSDIFTLIMLYFLFNSMFFIGDYLRFNLPSSGLITSFCASVRPNRWLGILIIYSYATNYLTIACPLLVCTVRLTIMISPRNCRHYSDLVMRWFIIPFLLLVPAALIFLNFHVFGYCRQLGPPFEFGSIMIYEGDEYYHTNTIIHFSFSCFMLLSGSIISMLMLFQLRMTVPSNTSARTKELRRKIELSLSLTMLSGMVPFITNSIVSVTFLWSRSNWFASLILHPIGNDFETVMMPWVLFFTHPLFRKKNMVPKMSTSSVASKSTSGRKVSTVTRVL